MIVAARALGKELARGLGPALAGVGLVIAGWLYLRSGSANLMRIASPDMHMHVDFDSFWRSSVALRHGGDLYRTGAELPNLNPPLLAVLLIPLASLDPLSAYHAFALLTVVLILASVIAVAEQARTRVGWAMVAVAALLASSPMHGTLALGQVYGLLTAALTLAWLAERRNRAVIAGIAVGLAIALKPSLLPLLAWPVLRRRSGMLSAALVAGAVGTGVGIAAAGWSATLDWLRELAAQRPDGFLDNDSLGALAVRFGQPIWCGYLAASVLLVITVRRARHRPEIAVWALTAAALLLAPIAWNNYLVLLAPAVPLLLAQGGTAAALPLMALPLIGIEWSGLLTGYSPDSTLARLGMSLYCGMLLTYWAVLTFGPVEPPAGAAGGAQAAPVTVNECRCSSVPLSDRHSPGPLASR